MTTRVSARRVDDFQAALDDVAATALRDRGQPVSYARGRTVFHEGQVPDRVLLLRSGVVKVRLVTRSGREVVLAFRGPGELIGEQSALDGSPRSATIVAVEPVEALAFTQAAFRRFLLDHPGAALALLAIMSRRLREADARRAEFSSLPALGRVASRLLEFSDRFGLEAEDGTIRISLPITQKSSRARPAHRSSRSGARCRRCARSATWRRGGGRSSCSTARRSRAWSPEHVKRRSRGTPDGLGAPSSAP
jgi:CRP-like cAMP-binding protein